ncbi:MAG: phosphonate ABC transporter, permease protein PhnE [Candidatus Methylomirabilales bacterium]
MLFLTTFVGSWRLTHVDLPTLFSAEALGSITQFVRGGFPPRVDAEFLGQMAWPVVETIQISIAGTVLALLIGFPLSVLATHTLSLAGILNQFELGGFPGRRALRAVPYIAARGVLSLLRSVPELVWALIFVRAVGLGPFPGVLAIGVAYGGILGKVFAELFEDVSQRPLEALQATGSGRPAVFLYGMLPQAFPNLVSYTLYRWECAMRASAVLGLVGAGGIGQQIEVSMRMFAFNEVATQVLILFTLVALTDLISFVVRQRIQ